MTEFFTSKQPSEAYYLGFDFTADLGATETVASAAITAVERNTLQDVTATLLDATLQSNGDQVVYAWVRGGTSGREYLLTCRITGSLGSEYELDGILPVEEVPVEEAATTFRDRLRLDLGDVFYKEDEFAVTATYTPATGTEKNINVIATYGDGDEYKGADSYGVRCTLRLKASDIAQPARSDEMTIGTVRWIVTGAELNEDGLEWVVQANKVTS